jgi:exopolysaccharide/PEP-CTERM locus tyrosine autokinase
MSVIENALKKLQSQSPGGQHNPHVVNPHGVFGAVTPGGATAKRLPAPEQPAALPVPTRTVTIDQRALRTAGLLPPEHQERELARQYRQIKRPLISAAMGRGQERSPKGNLIMVASAMPGEGKTFMSLNLAFSIAREKDLSVLLVDGDVAKPQISKLLGADAEAGLLDVLRTPSMDVESVVLGTDVPNLFLLPAGRQSDNATELLTSQRMNEVLSRMSERFPSRIVVFDSPPLLLTAESQALAQELGQIVVVVRAGYTPQQAVLDAVEMLGTSKPVSLVLNQSMRTPNSDYYYYYNNSNDEQRERPPSG